MRKLSISQAWEETRSLLGSDGRLLASVALALIALPSAISALISPNNGPTVSDGTFGSGLVALVMSIIALVGQLAIIRLAIGPSISVGGAIAHAGRRVPIFLVSLVILIVALFIIAVPFVLLLGALGVSFERGGPPPSGAAWIAALLFLIALVWLMTRTILSSSVASAENVGPIGILRRSWALTSGHSGKLFGFLLLMLIAILVVVGAASIMLGLFVQATAGELEPMSASALVVGLVEGLIGAGVTVVFAVMLARIYLQLAGSDGSPEVSVPSSGT